MDSPDDKHEPSLLSNDPNERKLARRLRIERRYAVLNMHAGSDRSLQEDEHTSAVQAQAQRSAELLEKFVLEGEEYITNVRVANDAREVDRREAEGIGREKIINQLEDEANEARSAFEKISTKWSTIQKYNDPLHIHEDITNQKEKCELLIKQKDGIIAMLRDEIRNSERKFTRDQRRQEEDVDRLAQRIEKQMVFMRHAYRTELELIEQVMLDERKKHIEKADKRWEELYKEREHLEIENSEEKFEQVERFNKRISELRDDFYERFRKTKIDLDDDIAELRQNFEDIKALALLNREKLDYNYQILKKREDENLLLKTQQKRRLNRLHDVISELKVKIGDYEKASRNKIRKLKENIDNMKKQINEIEAKADHFAKVNDDRFNQIWDMNETTCHEVLSKILSIDRVIYEQQLGIAWEPPSTALLKKTALRSYKVAVNFLRKTDEPPKAIVSSSRVSESMAGLPTVLTLDGSENERPSPLYRTLIRKILGQVADKAGFLSEKRLKVLLKNYVTEHQDLVRLDNMFMSLGILKKEEVEMLIKHFLPYSYCLICRGSTMEQKSSTGKHPLSINRMSSVVFGSTSFENADVYEIDEAFMAIQQPENVITEIVNDLVNSEIMEERGQGEEGEYHQYDVCGGPLLVQSTVESKEKITKKRTYQKKEKIRCPYNHPMFLPSVYIMIGLRDFVADYYKSLVNYPTMNERVKKQRKTISRMLSNEDMQQFWQKFRSICGDEKLNLWKATLRALKEYHEILKDRKTLSEEVVGLRRQNRDLRRLLANYIDAGTFMEPVCSIEKGLMVEEAACMETRSRK